MVVDGLCDVVGWLVAVVEHPAIISPQGAAKAMVAVHRLTLECCHVLRPTCP